MFEEMFPTDPHRGPLDDDRRRLARVFPGSTTSVYRPLRWTTQSPPTNGVLPARPDHDVTSSGSRDELAPPPAKMPRHYVSDHLLSPTSAPAGKYDRYNISGPL